MSALLPSMRNRLCSVAFRTSRQTSRSFSYTPRTSNQGPGTGENFNQANDPKPRQTTPNVSKTNEVAVDAMGAQDAPLQQPGDEAEKMREMQAPNREDIWSRSQMPRELAMSGPRFEQTILETQPRPYAAIDLIHKQPVRWVDTSSVACDGGGGPLGHPRIFINVDKPQICWCTYCGLPYAHLHHKQHLETLPKEQLNYPLEPSGDPAQVRMPDTPTQMGEIQGQYPRLKGELNAENVDEQPFQQR